MLFNSYEFIFAFLPFTFLIYFYLNKRRLLEISKGFLVLSSLFFYRCWNPIYLPLILISMLFNYVIGKSLSSETKNRNVKRKNLLVIGIIGNIGLLGYFKYSDFLIQNINLVIGSDIPLLNLALPYSLELD